MSRRPGADRDSQPWWDGLARHELPLQTCAACGARRWPPRDICGRCGSLEWRWEAASGRATLASWIVNHHLFDPRWRSPFVVVLARLAEGEDILVPGGWAGPDGGDGLSIGSPVVAGFDDDALLCWRPA